MSDLKINIGGNDYTITADEIQRIVDANEEEDVIGIEQDLQALLKSRYSGTVNVVFHIRYMKPFPAITFAKTSNLNWWAS